MKGLLILILAAVAAIGVSAAGLQIGSAEHHDALNALEHRVSLIEAALDAAESSASKGKPAPKPASGRPDDSMPQFALSDKMLDRLGTSVTALKQDVRQIFTETRMRQVEASLRSFDSMLKASYAAQGLSKFYPVIIKEAGDYFSTVPRSVEWTSRVWHKKESADAQTGKINNYERDITRLSHAYNWLLHHSSSPFPQMAKVVSQLKATRAALQDWVATSPEAVESFLEAGSTTEAEVESEADAEAAAEAELEQAAEADAEAEAEADAEADADEEADVDAEEEGEADADADAEAEEEGEADADQADGSLLESGMEAVSAAALAAEAQADTLFASQTAEADASLAALLDLAMEGEPQM